MSDLGGRNIIAEARALTGLKTLIAVIHTVIDAMSETCYSPNF